MALKRGVVTFRSRMPIPCRGGLAYGNRYFRCWEPGGHGTLTLSEAIAQSCDVYFYQLGLKLGLTSLLEDANQWGLHARTGIDLPGETVPEFPSNTEYFDRVYGPRRWTTAVTLNLAIGQGENAQTLVDMPEIVVGAIVEHAEHGSGVAPLVARVIARYLGADTTVARTIRLALPTDTAPHARDILPGTPADTASVRDTAPLDTVPPESTHAVTPPPDR